MKIRNILGFIATAALSHADAGKTTYTTFCSACHGLDGKGVEGAAPPLAGSEWVGGDANRMVQVLVNGLQGKIQVQGKQYNLVMPPQSYLNDQQVAEVTNYVRSSWGNTGEAIDEDFVKQSRAKHASQTGMWEGSKLLEIYPFANAPVPIEHLIAYSYDRKASMRPLNLLAKAKSIAVEEEASGFIDPAQGPKKSHYAIKWTGQLTADEAGEYEFSFKTQQAANLSINGEMIINREGMGKRGLTQPTVAKVNLPAGKFDIEIQYVKTGGKTVPICELHWSGPGFKNRALHNEETAQSIPEIVISPSDGKAVVHRNFILESNPRALAVGYPEKVNFTFCAEKLGPGYFWQGGFINAGYTWDGRGRGEVAVPLSTDLKTVAKDVIWRADQEVALDYGGYELDQNLYPTFLYGVSGVSFKDDFRPSSDGTGFTRNIMINSGSGSLPKGLKMLIAEASGVTPALGKAFKAAPGFSITVEADNASLTGDSDGVHLNLTPQTSAVTITYNWN